jgi:MraZ protein
VPKPWGPYFPKLDTQGRFSLPAKTRELLGEGGYLTQGQDRCLYFFTEDQFATYQAESMEKEQELGMLPRYFDQNLYGNMSAQEPDRSGRLTIPAELRELVGLKDELVMLVMPRRTELWDKATWQAHLEKCRQMFAENKQGVR